MLLLAICIIFSYTVHVVRSATLRNGEILNISDLELDSNGHLASHWLLFTEKCGFKKMLDTWNYQSESSDLRQISLMSANAAMSFLAIDGTQWTSDGNDCMAVCLERGTPSDYINVPIPEAIWLEDTTEGIEKWIVEACVDLEFGFISYYPHVVYINWISSKGEVRRLTELQYGEQETYWTGSRLGHRFEAIDSSTNKLIKSYVADYNAFNPVGYPDSVLQTLPDEEDQVKAVFRDEVDRSRAVKRTFTEFGFAKGRLPDDVWGSMQAYHYNNRVNWTPEEYGDVSINWYEVPSLFLGMPWGLKGYWQTRLQEVVQRWVGEHVPIENTDIYGIRKYQDGARLLSHVDRTSTHAVSLIVNIAQEGVRSPWYVQIYDHAYRLHEIEMSPGEIVYYESARCLHGRMTPLDGGYYVNLFTHYRPLNDPEWYLKPNPEGTPEPVYELNGREVPTLSSSGHTVQSDADLFDFWMSVSPMKSNTDTEL